MKTCPNCNHSCSEEDVYCESCGAKLTESNTEKDNNSSIPKWTKITIALLGIAILVLLFIIIAQKKNHTESLDYSDSVTTSLTTVAFETNTYSEPGMNETNPEGDIVINAPINNNIYWPEQEFLLKEVKTGYVYCTDEDIQDYVKMRYGPDKQEFEVIKKIPNNTGIVVESEDINGWTLVYCQGDEGWCRTDFVFPDELGYDNYLLNEYHQYKE